VLVLREAGSIALEKVTLRFSLTATAAPPLTGEFERTVGAGAGGGVEPLSSEEPQAVSESSRSDAAPRFRADDFKFMIMVVPLKWVGANIRVAGSAGGGSLV